MENNDNGAKITQSDIKPNSETNSNNFKKSGNNNTNKAIFNFNAIINNLKISLEKFDSSIRELKMNMDKDRVDKDKKIKDLAEQFNAKLNNIKKDLILQENNYSLKNNNKINSLSSEQINEIISRLYSLEQKMELYEEKSNDIESNLSAILTDFDNKNKASYNELLKRINCQKNENEYSSRSNKKGEDYALNKNIENIVRQKVGEILDKKMQIFDEKIQILNTKVINLEIKNQNKLHERNSGDNSFIKDNNFTDIILADKFDKKIQALKTNFNNKLIKLYNKLGITDLEDIDVDNSNNDDNEDINNENENNNVDLKELDLKLMNEISNKFKIINDDIDNKINNSIDNKINDIKNNILSSVNKASDKPKDTHTDINIKLSSFKTELFKMMEAKNSYFDGKIKNIDAKANKLISETQSYYDKINSLENKIKNIDNKLRIVDNKFANITNDINSNTLLNNSYITNQKNLLNDDSAQKINKLNLSINITSSDKSIDLDTSILTKEQLTEDFFLFSKIKETFPYNMTFRYKLIYRATRDGDSAKNFHQKCDYIGPNIILIRTKKDFIFGGVTSKSWKHLLKDIKKDDPEYGTEIKDEKAFGFSINEKKIYKNGKPSECAIFCNNNYGPVFKNNYFKIYNECLDNGGICGNMEESNFIGQEKDYEINGGEEKFDIEDIEIFQIGFK